MDPTKLPPVGGVVTPPLPPVGGTVAVSTPPPPRVAPGGPSALESVGRGLAQGATFRWGDEVEGAIQALFPVAGDAPTFGERYDRAVRGARAEDAAAKAAHPVAYGGSELVGALPATLATGGASTAAGRVAGAGLAGAVQGAGAGEGAAGTALGAGVGGVVGAGGQAVLGEMAAPWLSQWFARRERDLALEKLGLTRAMRRAIDKRGGNQDEYEASLDQMYEALKAASSKYGGKGREAIDAAIEDAKQTIGGFFKQADQAQPGGRSLTHQDIISLADAVRAKAEGRTAQAAASNVLDDAGDLWNRTSQGDLGFDQAHRTVLNEKEALYSPATGLPAAPNSVAYDTARRFWLATQDALRGRARAATPPGAPIPVQEFDQAVGSYTALKDLDRAARQGTSREGALSYLLSAINRTSPAVVGALAGGGSLAYHGNPLVAAGLAGGAALGKAAWSSPAVNHAASSFMGSQAPSVIGRELQLPALQLVLGQRLSADAFAAGNTPESYDPPSPLKEK